MSTNIGAGGYHWQSEENVERWVETRRSSSPDRDEGFAAMLEQLPKDLSTPLRFVDLGAGEGRVASIILDRYPNATAVLVDFSDPMMVKGDEALSRFAGRYDYLKWDMNEGDWPQELSGPYDAIVSAASLHHLHDDRKNWITQAIADHLVSGGLYSNLDVYRNEDAVFAEEDVHSRTLATVASALSFLDNAGFVDVVLTARAPREPQQGERALITGRKP